LLEKLLFVASLASPSSHLLLMLKVDECLAVVLLCPEGFTSATEVCLWLVTTRPAIDPPRGCIDVFL